MATYGMQSGQVMPVLYIPKERRSIRLDLVASMSVEPPLSWREVPDAWALVAETLDGVRFTLGLFPDEDAAEEAFEAVYAYLGWPHGTTLDAIIERYEDTFTRDVD